MSAESCLSLDGSRAWRNAFEIILASAGERAVSPKRCATFQFRALHKVLPTSEQARLPAEFKHINKRRKRN